MPDLADTSGFKIILGTIIIYGREVTEGPGESEKKQATSTLIKIILLVVAKHKSILIYYK